MPSVQDPPTQSLPADEKLANMRKESQAPGGSTRVQAQHDKGKLTARERIELLLDPGSFVEIDAFVRHKNHRFGMEKRRPLGDGVVVGHGTIEGRPVVVYSQDFTVFGGSLGKAHADKICKVLDLAIEMGVPAIGLLDSGGARIQEGIESLAGYGEIFTRNVRASGVIPQISIILGPCAGGAVYSPALTDFIIMSKETSFMFVTGPQVVKEVTGEEVSFYDLGGANIHASKSGVCHLVGETDEESIFLAKKLLSYLPQNNLEDPPIIPPPQGLSSAQALREIVPMDGSEPYNMKDVIQQIADPNTFFEIHPNWARNIIVGFIRLEGRPVGVIANQPLYLGGAIDSDASDKSSRFIRFCDAFNIPILTLVDVPGFMPGVKQETEGIIRHGAKMLFAYAEATVPKIAVILRKAFGGAYIVMSSKHLGSDMNFAWPNAEVAVMGAEGAVNILYRKQLAASKNNEQGLARFIQEFKEEFANPYQAAENGYVDKVIFPEETRAEIARALKFLDTKRLQPPKRKHGIMPV